MKKAGLFSKSGCNWRVTPGSNPSSKQKRANPIYENETQFLREKSPQTLGITGKKHCRTLLFGNDVFTLQKRSGRSQSYRGREHKETVIVTEIKANGDRFDRMHIVYLQIKGLTFPFVTCVCAKQF